MTSLAESIDQLEQDYVEAQNEIDRLNSLVSSMEDDVASARYDADEAAGQVEELEEFQEWVFDTYPDIKIAYEVRQRLEQAANGTTT